MNVLSISDQLPTYPNNIQGELRIILQTKDVFLVCYKHLEEYRRLVNEQNRLITKEFVQEQLQIGEDEISELKMELQDAESRLGARLRHNELLADHLASLGYASLESGASVRHLALCRSPQMRKNMLAQRQGGSNQCDPRPPTHMIDNIALAISEIHQEVRSKVKPLLDYYRDLFYLQLHFSLVLGQVCNYCMPLVTENIGLIDRIFFWSERPEFDLVRKAGDIGDRLKEIYTRAQTVLSVLAESVQFLQSKVDLQKTLEQRFHERLDEQQKTKDKILREVHSTKQNMDMLEEENDRLVGSLVKVDPSFVDSRHFYELAEGGNLLGAKKSNPVKETTQNNSEVVRDSTNNSTLATGRAEPVVRVVGSAKKKKTQVREASRRVPDTSSPSCLENATDEVNNNKAISCMSESAVVQPKKKSSTNADAEGPRRESKTKPRSASRRGSKRIESTNGNNTSHSARNSSNHCQYSLDASTPTPTVGVDGRSTRTRSRSSHRQGSQERQRPHNTKDVNGQKVRKRATSADRHARPEKVERAKRYRPKSTIGEIPTRDVVKRSKVKDRKARRSVTPKVATRNQSPSPLAFQGGDFSPTPARQPSGTLKSKLLGRTRDLLEAALHRSPKMNSLTEPVSRMTGPTDSSVTPERLESDEVNNDAVTSVSSFASLLVTEDPILQPSFAAPATFTNTKHLRSLKPHKNLAESPGNDKKKRSSKKSKRRSGDFEAQPLPQLNSNLLAIDTRASGRLQSTDQFGSNLVTSNLQNLNTSRGSGKLSDYLAGATSDSLVSTTSVHSTLQSIL